MIPVSLTIEGLYSYRERQTIDFEALTSGQLFGIFGGVGSGKSSILEAIMFVLYDRSPRLSARGDNRYYNMLNLQSDRLLIDFTFRSGSLNNQTYRFTFLANRKKKDYDKVEAKERAYYKREGEEWVPLPDDTDAADVVGMSYEHFMQTIIIPQGKFREFIDQTPTDRTRMLQELFHLDKFDLYEPANRLRSKAKDDLLVLDTQLEGLAEVSEEDLAAGQQAIIEQKENLLDHRGKLSSLQQQQKECDRLRGLYDTLKAYREELKNLEGQKEDFGNRRTALARYELAVAEFRDKLAELDRLQSDLQTKEEQVGRLRKESKSLEDRLAQAKETHQKAEKEYEKRDELRQQLEDLELIVQVKEASLEDSELTRKLENQESACEKLKSRFQQAKARLEEVRKELAELEVTPDREGEIITALNSMQARAQHSLQTEKLTRSAERERQQLQAYENDLKEKALNGRLTGSSPAELQEQATAKLGELEQQLSDLTEEKNKLRVRDKLSEWANDLEEGQPCPLCGATHHPEVADFDSVHRQLEELAEREKSLKEATGNMRELKSEIVRLAVSIENAQKQLASRQSELSEHSSQTLPDLPAGYENETEESLQRQLAETKRQRAKRNELTARREAEEASLEKIRSELESEERNCQDTRSEQRVVSAGIADKKQRIKVLPADKFLTKEVEELKASTIRGQQKIADLEKNYQQTRREEEGLRQTYDQKSGTLLSEQTFLQQLNERTATQWANLDGLASAHGFGSVDSVRTLLRTGLNVTGEKEALAAFDKKLHSLANQIEKCEADTEGQSYDETSHQQVNRDLEELNQTITDTEKQLAVAEKERQRKLDLLEKKNALLTEKEALEIRLGNLTEITNLFRSSGFVKYVSSIRLRELCQAANERFFKLTKNNLSLELNEKDEFIVRDYLNNGRTRLLKTLSGGQTFQAALCLALALAENIRSLNEADQSFFFLDEGFGSLDKDSLRIVFETLKSLRKENRIVGIISHVEELQQEIDLYLKVENDKERGSVIEYSWKV